MLKNVRDTSRYPKATYIDKQGHEIEVEGTWALGVPMSWHTKDGTWVIVCGKDQGRIFPAKELIWQKVP